MSKLTKEELLNNPLVKELLHAFADADEPFESFKAEQLRKEKKPEYTILAFRSKKTGSIFHLTDKYFYVTRGGWEEYDGSRLDQAINTINWEIYSVRRESDGEVFTVGDKLEPNMTLHSFEITDGVMLVKVGTKATAWTDFERMQKAKPEEWEITAFRVLKECMSTYTKGRVFKRDGILFSSLNTMSRAEDFFTNQPQNFEIYSVKRLSDGVEFKIGDKVKDVFKNSPDKNKVRLIEKIVLQDNGLLLFFLNTNGTYVCFINHLEKVKKLFTTEDGVDIYERDRIYTVTDKLDIVRDFIVVNNYPPSQLYKCFSTKEAGEEYILMNKPCLSVNDIESFGKGHSSIRKMIDDLKGFAKTKLK